MKLGNEPAMPLPEPEQWVDPFNPSKGTYDANGLTKREYFAVHAPVCAKDIKFNDQKTLEAFLGREVDFESTEDVIKAQIETLAKAGQMYADALLNQLQATEGE